LCFVNEKDAAEKSGVARLARADERPLAGAWNRGVLHPDLAAPTAAGDAVELCGVILKAKPAVIEAEPDASLGESRVLPQATKTAGRLARGGNGRAPTWLAAEKTSV
jgi:hypothetical protein